MFLSDLHVRNFRGFADSGVLKLDRINVLLGANNSGKSSLLRALCLLQDGLPLDADDVRIGENEAFITAGARDFPGWLVGTAKSRAADSTGLLREAAPSV